MDDINRYFEILGLKPGASLDEVKEAYLDLVKVWHPDRFAHDPKLQQKAQEKLKEINEAYQKIQDFLNNYYKYQESFKSDSGQSSQSEENFKSEAERQSTTSENKDYSSSQPPPQQSSIRTVRDSSSLTKWVKNFLYASIVIEIITLVGCILQYQLLSDFKQGVYTSISLATAAAEANDERQQIIFVFNRLFFIITAILFLRWIHRANYNARQLGAKNMKFTPGWAIGWYFIPIASLWKPYQAMKEIWKASKKPDDWETQSGSPILPWWWFFYIMFSYLGVVSFRHFLRAKLSKELNELIEATTSSIAYDIFSIPLTILTIVLVSRIYEMQTSQSKGTITENVTKKSGNIAAWIFGIIGLCIVAAIVIPYYVGVQERARTSQNEQASAPAPKPADDEWLASLNQGNKSQSAPPLPPAPSQTKYESPTPNVLSQKRLSEENINTTESYQEVSKQEASLSPSVPVKRPEELIVKDKSTGLMWARDANLGDKDMYKGEALNFVDQLNRNAFAGYKDWRLPTVDELTILAKHKNIEASGFTNVQTNYVSSSGASIDINDRHVFYYGHQFGHGYIWPVRSDK